MGLERPDCSQRYYLALALLMVHLCAAAGCQQAPPPEVKAKEPMQVRLVPATEGTLSRTVTVTGTLAADEAVTAAFKVSGRVSEITVDLGALVTKGQILARLDATDFRLRVDQAMAAQVQARTRLGLSPDGTEEHVNPEETASVREAQAVLADARLHRDRLAGLAEQKLISQAEYETAMSAFLVAEGRYQASIEDIQNRQAVLAEKKSELAMARQQLSDAFLHASMDGSVRERLAAVGEFLPAGEPVVVLVRLHPLRLKMAVPERDAPAIGSGQPVQVWVEGDATAHQGRIVRLSPVIDEKNRTLLVEAEVDNQDGRLRPGSFARAEIKTASELKAILVPAKAIVNFAGIDKVISEKDGRAVERRVRTGTRVNDQVEIVEGLKPGELIVAEPGNLASGQPVTKAR